MGQLDSVSIQLLDGYFSSNINFESDSGGKCKSAHLLKNYTPSQSFLRIHEKILNNHSNINSNTYFPPISIKPQFNQWATKIANKSTGLDKQHAKRASQPQLLFKRSQTSIGNTDTPDEEDLFDPREYKCNPNVYFWYYKEKSGLFVSTPNPDDTLERKAPTSIMLTTSEKIYSDEEVREKQEVAQIINNNNKTKFPTVAPFKSNIQQIDKHGRRVRFYPLKSVKRSQTSFDDEVKLSVKQLKEMPISKNFLSDAQNMIYQPKTLSFVPNRNR